jgi:hypothetical protein
MFGTFWDSLERSKGDRMKAEQDTRTGAELETVEQVETLTPYQIHNNQIEVAVADFIGLEFPDLSNEDIKKTRQFFPMLIQYLYQNVIGDLLGNKDKTKKTSYPDIVLLDNLFWIYIDLVNRYKFNNRPTVLEFSILTCINRDTFYSWLNGSNDNTIYNNSVLVNGLDKETESKGARKYITPLYADTVKKWIEVCEQALVDGSGDTIKEIFLLKAKYNYRDNSNVIEINHNVKPLISADVLPSLVDLKSNN